MAADDEDYGGVLGTWVHLDGRAYGPPDGELPAAVSRRITNPDVWAEEPRGAARAPEVTATSVDPLEAVRAELARLRGEAADARRDIGAGTPADQSVDTAPRPDAVTGNPPPPRNGAGSALSDWLAYADRVGVAVPEESRGKRDDVISVIEAAGKPVDRK